jgi:predicted amidohydrolase YtcJ
MNSGEVLSVLDLTKVQSLEDLKQLIIKSENFRGDWLVGFGWDQNLWKDPQSIHLSALDKIFPNYPVIFNRIDGHAIWVNSVAINRAKILDSTGHDTKGGRFERDTVGKLTGVLIDSARDCIDSILPKYTLKQIENFLTKAMELFHANGYTHIRDMGGSEECWQIARQMEDASVLKLFVEMNFAFDKFDDFKAALELAKNAKNEKSKLIRVAGLKFYFDGALGSEGALLSQAYPSGNKGLELYELSQVEEILRRTWEYGLPVAIHTLGDEAAHKIVRLAYELKSRGSEGLLHLEHCEVVRPETIRMMRALDIRCHLQPSHFLTDKKWLKQKLGDLYSCAFPWENLDESGISYSFGSDSPIEKPLLDLTAKGIDEASEAGIARPTKSIWTGHSHPDGSWGTDCVTRLFPTGEIQVEFKKAP